MQRNLRFTLTILCGAGLAGWPAGCRSLAPKDNIIKRTTEYNLVAERTGNEMLLLNIVRASQRRPMYFTSFGKLTGSLTYKYGTGEIKIPFGAIGSGENGAYSIAPNISYENSPLFDMAVLDTKEFMCGITTPASMRTVEYYWRQGWPKEMLLYLFINRIEIRDANDRVLAGYNNAPDDPNFCAFQTQIERAEYVWDIEEDPQATCIARVNTTETSQLEKLIEVQKAGLRLRPIKGRADKMELCSSQPQYLFTRVASPERRKMAAEKAKAEKPEAGKTRDQETGDGKLTFGPHDALVRKEGKHGVVYLRSPEAILYYLGEILRAEIRHKKCANVPQIHGIDKEGNVWSAWLFYACRSEGKEVAPWLSVEYEGARYVIPGHPDTCDGQCTDRSMHVLSLASQLIGMHKTSAELPATGVVNVIGR